jgi:hypothetical protein
MATATYRKVKTIPMGKSGPRYGYRRVDNPFYIGGIGMDLRRKCDDTLIDIRIPGRAHLGLLTCLVIPSLPYTYFILKHAPKRQ